jgi:hypothetical protein
MPIESITTQTVGVTDDSLNTIYIFYNTTMYIFDAFKNFLAIHINLALYNIYYYAAVMLNTDVIAYIGGSREIINIPMNEVKYLI